MKFRRKKREKTYGEYPCVVFLNNAIRFICEQKYDSAISEICYCISRANGYFSYDVKKMIVERNIERLSWVEDYERGK